jgi:hypothetical protein
MNDSFKIIHQLILSINTNDFETEKWRPALQLACSDFEKIIEKELIRQPAEEVLKRRVFHAQLSVYQLSKELEKIKKASPTLTSLNQASILLNGLLEYLIFYARKYISRDLPLPFFYLESAAAQYSPEISEIIRRLGDSNLCPKISALLSDFLGLFSKPADNVTLEDLDCAKQLIPVLLSNLPATGHEYHNTNRIWLELVKHGFQTMKFFDYSKDHLMKQIKDIKHSSDRVAKLSELRTDLLNQPVRTIYSSKPDWPGLKKMLCKWLNHQIKHEKALLQINEEINLRVEEALSDSRIQTTLSVPQLAVISKACVKTGVCQTDSTRKLLKKISLYAKSKSSSNISLDHLSNEYNADNPKAAEAVIQLLDKLHDSIKLEYFSKDLV